jgi:hypothetical protein
MNSPNNEIDRLYGIKGAYKKKFKEISDQPQITKNMQNFKKNKQSLNSKSKINSIPSLPSKQLILIHLNRRN